MNLSQLVLTVSSANNRSSAIFWLIILAVLASVVGLLVWNASQHRKRITTRLDDRRGDGSDPYQSRYMSLSSQIRDAENPGNGEDDHGSG